MRLRGPHPLPHSQHALHMSFLHYFHSSIHVPATSSLIIKETTLFCGRANHMLSDFRNLLYFYFNEGYSEISEKLHLSSHFQLLESIYQRACKSVVRSSSVLQPLRLYSLQAKAGLGNLAFWHTPCILPLRTSLFISLKGQPALRNLQWKNHGLKNRLTDTEKPKMVASTGQTLFLLLDSRGHFRSAHPSPLLSVALYMPPRKFRYSLWLPTSSPLPHTSVPSSVEPRSDISVFSSLKQEQLDGLLWNSALHLANRIYQKM